MTLRRWALISGNDVENIVDQEDQPVLFTEGGKFWVEDPEKIATPRVTKYENNVFVNPQLVAANTVG
jgi:hypothetical protein